MPWEQRGCGGGLRGAKHHLLIDKAIKMDSKEQKDQPCNGLGGLSEGIQHGPHSRIRQILDEMNIKRLLVNSTCIANWKTQLEMLDGQ